MEEYIIKKINFIHQELTALLRACDCDLRYIEYQRKDGEEYILLHSALGDIYRKVCITGDSNIAIVVDVLKKIY